MVKCKYGELVRPVTLPGGGKRRCKLKPRGSKSKSRRKSRRKSKRRKSKRKKKTKRRKSKEVSL
mgnify:CR=1 FL=1